jgi:copper chaperone
MLKSVTFQMTGDHRLACEHCERRVEELVGTLPGVKQVSAQANEQRIQVMFETAIVGPDVVAKRLADAGYVLNGVSSDLSSLAGSAKTRTDKSGWLGGVTSLVASAVGVVCPACIPTVATLLMSLGIGVAVVEQFMQPLLILLLAVAVAAFSWSAKLHRHWWVVPVGITGGILVYLGRYFWFGELWMNQVALWTGTGLLLGTSLVNLLLRRSCSRCQTSATASHRGGDEKPAKKATSAVNNQ